MASVSVSSLLRLSRKKRLEIAESLWLSVADDKMPVPVSHKRVLDARLNNYSSGQSKPIPHREVLRRLRAS